MDNFFETLSDFIGGIIATAILGGSILLIAGEIQLAALKKSQCSAKPPVQPLSQGNSALSRGTVSGYKNAENNSSAIDLPLYLGCLRVKVA